MPEPGPRVRMIVESDPRLVPGVGGAVIFLARLCKLDEKAGHDLQVAAESAVRDTFDLLTQNSSALEIRMEGFADRVEVVLEHHGEALPTAGLETFLNAGASDASSGAVTGLALMTLVDRVLYNTANGVSRTTLVKYLKKGKKS